MLSASLASVSLLSIGEPAGQDSIMASVDIDNMMQRSPAPPGCSILAKYADVQLALAPLSLSSWRLMGYTHDVAA